MGDGKHLHATTCIPRRFCLSSRDDSARHPETILLVIRREARDPGFCLQHRHSQHKYPRDPSFHSG
jgi:hypothetical protein